MQIWNLMPKLHKNPQNALQMLYEFLLRSFNCHFQNLLKHSIVFFT